eukprot:6150184-Ditylum_brightwellii.AAC.1
MERSKQKKHVVCKRGNDVDNYDDDSDDIVDNGVDSDNDSVDDGVDGADKHLAHLSNATDCCLMEGIMQIKNAVCNKDDSVVDGV